MTLWSLNPPETKCVKHLKHVKFKHGVVNFIVLITTINHKYFVNFLKNTNDNNNVHLSSFQTFKDMHIKYM